MWLPMGVVGGLAVVALVLVKSSEPTAPSTERHLSEPIEGAQPAASTKTAESPTANQPGRLQVAFENDLLTVRADHAQLKSVMKEISRRAFIAVELSDDIAADRISVAFAGLPLEDGLRRILAGYDVFSYYRGGKGLLTVWVYGRLEGRGLMPVPADTWASTADLEKRLEDADPGERAAALESLVERGGRVGRQAVLKGLADPDTQVRTLALYGALYEDLELPGDMLADLASNDASYNVRFLALRNLAGRAGELQAIVAALNDSNPVIRSYAESAMLRLYPSEGPSESGQLQNSNP